MDVKEVIMGLDPGIFTTGAAVIEAEKCLFTGRFDLWVLPENLTTWRAHGMRYVPEWVVDEVIPRQGEWLWQLLDLYLPTVLVVESAFWSSPSRSFSQVAEIRGALHYVAATHPVHPRWMTIPSPEVKKRLLGKDSRGDKHPIAAAMAARYALPELLRPKNNHQADAAAAACAWQLKQLPAPLPDPPAPPSPASSSRRKRRDASALPAD